MDVLEGVGKEVLDTMMLQQELDQLYRAYEA